MYKIELKKDYSIGVECQFSSARLIVFKQGIELGCRKEKIRLLKKFLENDETELFKGRLRLYKKRRDIIIVFKDQSIGSVYSKELERALDSIVAPL